MQVRVVGEQFAWTFFYKQADGKEVASRQLHVPIDRQVQFTLQSKDVLHDFWVPAFRMKKDAVPGIDVTYTRDAEPARRSYPIVCAELCGLGHAVMRSTAVVDSPRRLRDLARRRSASRRAPAAGGGRRRRRGRRQVDLHVQEANCASCHTLADAGANGTIGPDLDKVLADKDEAFIKESIVEPDKVIADGYQSGIMPATTARPCRADQLDALVKYLSEVTKGG